jgi:hypothetical protein
MTVRLIGMGISNLIGCTLWNIHQGMDPERVGAAFGGGFSMLVTLAFMSRVWRK